MRLLTALSPWSSSRYARGRRGPPRARARRAVSGPLTARGSTGPGSSRLACGKMLNHMAKQSCAFSIAFAVKYVKCDPPQVSPRARNGLGEALAGPGPCPCSGKHSSGPGWRSLRRGRGRAASKPVFVEALLEPGHVEQWTLARRARARRGLRVGKC